MISMKYIALLRGINVGGNNKVSMPELRLCFEKAGLKNVSTYINSGNVIFETGQTDVVELVRICEAAIEERFGFFVVCAVISAEELRVALMHAPEWWDKNKSDKNNAIFVVAPKTAAEVVAEIGDIKPEYEQVSAYGPVIFWTAPIESFGRTRYSKIVGTKTYKYVTIRNANTTKKLLELCG